MRVGVSMVQLASERWTGLERYSVQLLNALLDRAAPDVEVVPYVPAWAAAHVRGASVVAPVGWPRPLLNEVWLPARARRDRVDLLHECAFGPPALMRSRATMTVHDTIPWDLPDTISRGGRWYFRPSMTAALGSRHLRGKVVDASFTHERCRVLFSQSAPCVVAALGVDEHWSPGPAPTSGPPWRVLTVGTVEPRKGLDLINRTSAHLVELGIEHEWRLAGRQGWARSPTGVTVLGAVSDEELLEEYRSAHVLVSPSRYEGFGLPILEALACGTAVVASDLPAYREHFEPVVSLVPVDEPEAMAVAVRDALAAGPEGRAVRQHHAASFTWTRTADAVLDLWRQVGS